MDLRPHGDTPIEIETAPNPSAAVIWLHGLGADGYDFVPLVPELGLPKQPGVRFVFPHAPYRPVTINAGYLMRAWYDIAPGGRLFEQNAEHIREAEALVRELIARELARGIAPERIVLAGFSQGALVALHTGLRYPRPLAGLLILSAPITDPATLIAASEPPAREVPIFLAHGTEDPLIPYALAEEAHQALLQQGFRVEWHSYCIGHSVSTEETRDISRWLARVLDL